MNKALINRMGGFEDIPEDRVNDTILRGRHNFNPEERVPVLVRTTGEDGEVTEKPHRIPGIDAGRFIRENPDNARWLSEVEEREWQEKATYGEGYGTAAAALGVVDGLTFGMGGRILDELGLPVAEIKRQYGGTHTTADILTAIAASGLAIGTGGAATPAALSAWGKVAAKTAPGFTAKLGIDLSTKIANYLRVGGQVGAATKKREFLSGAAGRITGLGVEGFLGGAGYAASEADFGDPADAVEHILTTAGLSSMIGVGVVGALGAVKPLAVGAAQVGRWGFGKGLIHFVDSDLVKKWDDKLFDMTKDYRKIPDEVANQDRLYQQIGGDGPRTREALGVVLKGLDRYEDDLVNMHDDMNSLHKYTSLFEQSGHDEQFILDRIKEIRDPALQISGVSKASTTHMLRRLLLPNVVSEGGVRGQEVKGALSALRDDFEGAVESLRTLRRPGADPHEERKIPLKMGELRDVFPQGKVVDIPEYQQFEKWVDELNSIENDLYISTDRLSQTLGYIAPNGQAITDTQYKMFGPFPGFVPNPEQARASSLADFIRRMENGYFSQQATGGARTDWTYLDADLHADVFKRLEMLSAEIHERQQMLPEPVRASVSESMDRAKARITDILTEGGEYVEDELGPPKSMWGLMTVKKREMNQAFKEYKNMREEAAFQFLDKATDGTLVASRQKIRNHLGTGGDSPGKKPGVRNKKEFMERAEVGTRLGKQTVKLLEMMRDNYDVGRSWQLPNTRFETEILSRVRRSLDGADDLIEEIADSVGPALRFKDTIMRNHGSNEMLRVSPIMPGIGAFAGGLAGSALGPLGTVGGATLGGLGGLAGSISMDAMMDPAKHAARIQLIQVMLNHSRDGFDGKVSDYFKEYSKGKFKGGALPTVMRSPRYLMLNSIAKMADPGMEEKPDTPAGETASVQDIKNMGAVIARMSSDDEFRNSVYDSSSGPLEQLAPRLNEEYKKKYEEYIALNERDRPKGIDLGPLHEKIEPTEQELRAWLDLVNIREIGEDELLRRAFIGDLDDKGLEAFEEFYPIKFAKLQYAISAAISEMEDPSKDLGAGVKIALSKVVPGLSVEDPGDIARFQESFKPKEQGPSGATPAAPKGLKYNNPMAIASAGTTEGILGRVRV